MLRVTLYSKPDCHLCEQLHDDLAFLQREITFAVDSQDITQDERLFAQLRYLIPVLEIAGVMHYPPHDLLRLRTELLAAQRAAT